MANLSLELLTTGQGFSPIQVKGENMTHLVTAYHRKYVHLITFKAITSPTAPLGQDAIWQALARSGSIRFYSILFYWSTYSQSSSFKIATNPHTWFDNEVSQIQKCKQEPAK